jgi:hypothetical protein
MKRVGKLLTKKNRQGILCTPGQKKREGEIRFGWSWCICPFIYTNDDLPIWTFAIDVSIAFEIVLSIKLQSLMTSTDWTFQIDPYFATYIRKSNLG